MTKQLKAVVVAMSTELERIKQGDANQSEKNQKIKKL
jgi:hypothetical protein